MEEPERGGQVAFVQAVKLQGLAIGNSQHAVAKPVAKVQGDQQLPAGEPPAVKRRAHDETIFPVGFQRLAGTA